MKVYLKYLLSVLLLSNALVFFAQEQTGKSFTVAPTDISASQYLRNAMVLVDSKPVSNDSHVEISVKL